MAKSNEPSSNQYAEYTNYVAQVLLASQVGSVPTIPNALASGELDTAILLDPVKIKAYRASIASALNDGSAAGRYEDLEDRIADVIIETVNQGAGTLEVHVIDPLWIIPQTGFFQTDENGFLWPPIDINFPTDTNCVWRLVQYNASYGTDMSEANLILTFEDRIISLLRDISAADGGRYQGQPNQTLSGFIQELVSSANNILSPTPPIRYVSMVSPQDPNYTPEQTQKPSDPEKNLRTDPLKQNKGLPLEMQQLLKNIDEHQLGAFPKPGQSSTIREQENRLMKLLGLNKAPDPLTIGRTGLDDGFPN